MQAQFSQQDAFALLKLQLDMGIDEALDDSAGDYLRTPARPVMAVNNAPAREPARYERETPTARPVSRERETAGPSPSIAAAIAEARALADAATDLASLEAAVRGFEGCPLKKTATNTVFARGAAESRVVFIGEAPGAEEDKMGVPFCGPSGQLLDTMLKYIGLNDSNGFYITNTIFWRPPGNRQPTPEEIAVCKPLVEKHIALLNPKVIVLVGGTATKALLETSEGITRLRGKQFDYANPYMKESVPVRAIFHPSYLLRQPLAKKDVWADLLTIKSELLR